MAIGKYSLKPTQLRRLFSLRYHPHFPATLSPEILTTKHSLFRQQPRFFNSSSPYGVWFGVTKPAVNWGIVSVPDGKAAVVERNRRYSETVNDAGIFMLNPFVLERIAYLYPPGREQPILLNPYVGKVGCEGGYANIFIDGVIRLKIVDPKLAFYSDRDGAKSIQEVLSHAQKALLDELRGMTLFFRPCAADTLQKCKDTLRKKIVKTINERSIKEWGLQCVRCELYNIYLYSDPLDSELKAQDAPAEKALAMFAIWNSFDKAITQIIEGLHYGDSYIKPSPGSANFDSLKKSETWATQALIRVLTDFIPFVLELVNECEHSQTLTKDINSASESLSQGIQAIVGGKTNLRVEGGIGKSRGN